MRWLIGHLVIPVAPQSEKHLRLSSTNQKQNIYATMFAKANMPRDDQLGSSWPELAELAEYRLLSRWYKSKLVVMS